MSKISDLTVLTTPADGDLLELVDVSDTTYAATGTNKKITRANLLGTATPAEMNVLDGVTAGEVTASKALVVGADKELDEVHAEKLYLGSGAGAEMTSSAPELNALDGVTAGTVVASKAFVADSNKEITGFGWNGWCDANETWTYASADDPTFTFTITGDQTGKYSAGMKLKLTQTTVKYFIITAVAYSSPNTTVTIYGGTDYNLVDAAISANYYSCMKAPQGFPLDVTKWTVLVEDTANRTQATPTQNTWYNLGSISIAVPIGAWDASYVVLLNCSDAGIVDFAVWGTLSTANNSATDADWTSITQASHASGTLLKELIVETTRMKHIVLTTKDTYYLNGKTNKANQDGIAFRGDVGTTRIRFVCAYL